jgi:hypothetical protein
VGVTPDRAPGPSIEEELQLEDRTADGNPTIDGAIRLVSDDIVVKLSTGVKSMTTGSGLSEGTHKTLRQLIHFIEDGPAEGFTSGAYREVTGTVFPTAFVWWESSSKLKKIVERLVTWTGVNATEDKWKIYDTDGSTVLWTVTDAISYSGVFETSRTRTITSGDA